MILRLLKLGVESLLYLEKIKQIDYAGVNPQNQRMHSSISLFSRKIKMNPPKEEDKTYPKVDASFYDSLL